jgi:hypothetical protein
MSFVVCVLLLLHLVNYSCSNNLTVAYRDLVVSKYLRYEKNVLAMCFSPKLAMCLFVDLVAARALICCCTTNLGMS